jgi:hypothetical protein
MLTLVVPETELFDEVRNEFIFVKEQKLTLEHSLLSLSKWESKWHKPFLSKKEKTREETLDYLRCMTINSVDEEVYACLTPKMIERVDVYIGDSMTATTFSDKKRPSHETITAELIYYWMVALNIPFECQKWHLNRLLTLVEVCSIKNQPPKKMSPRAIMQRNAALNASRRKALHSKG